MACAVRWRVWVTVLVGIAAVACSAGSDGTTAPDIASTVFAPSLGVNLAASTRTSSGLYYRDIVTGTGVAAQSGNVLTVHYTGALANGLQFEANLPGSTPFGFTLGFNQVIAGWDQGIVGMRVGGSRQLIIPPNLGYGQSSSGNIPGNSILVFTVDLVSLR